MSEYPPQSPWSTGISGRCPRCGQGRLFSGFFDIADHCDQCGLDFGKANVGDGPIPFIILIVGFIGVGLGLWLQLAFDAPIWFQMVVTMPVIIVIALAMIRPLKGILLALQYQHRAGDTGGDTFDEKD